MCQGDKSMSSILDKWLFATPEEREKLGNPFIQMLSSDKEELDIQEMEEREIEVAKYGELDRRSS